MTPDDTSAILDAIDALRESEALPLEALEVIQDNWTAAAPHLLEALQGEIDLYLEDVPVPESESDEIDEDALFPEFDDLVFQACYLFGQHRHRDALPEMLRLLELPFVEEALGDFLFEGLPRCLAACSGSGAKELREVLADVDTDEFARSAAWSALLSLVAWGELPVETALDDLRARLSDSDDGDATFLRGSLVMDLAGLPADDFCLALARKAITDKHVDSEFGSADDFEAERRRFRPDAWREDLRETHGGPIEDAIAEIEPWFEESDDDVDDEGYDADGNWIPPEPVEQRKSDKVGRNDLCPCGSGAKYKKCCGKDE